LKYHDDSCSSAPIDALAIKLVPDLVGELAFVNHNTTSLIKMELINLIRRFAYATQRCLEPLLKMRITP
jgi:hypothetical protein